MINTLFKKIILPPSLAKFSLVRKLGEGKYGKTYLIQNQEDKFVFKKLKRINKIMGSKVTYEMEILSTLNHPNIPKIYYIIDEKGKMISSINYKNVKNPKGYVIEYIEGPTLYDMLNKENYIFDNKEVWQIANQLMDIVIYLQENNIVHRDIRTPNVIKSNGKYYLLDFGLARPISKKRKYQYDIDFTYIADFLLYLLYSSYNFDNKESKSWYEELEIPEIQKTTLKKMFSIDGKYDNVYQLKKDIDLILKN